MFEELKANIKCIESQGDAPVEDLLDSMCKLFDGVSKSNSAVVDIEEYGISMVNLFDRIIPSYRKNADLLENLNDEDVNEVVESVRGINDELTKLRPILEKLSAEHKKLKKLQEDYDRESRNKDKLEQEIQQMRNISIDDIKAEKKKLDDEKNKRKKNEKDFKDVENKLADEIKTNVDLERQLSEAEKNYQEKMNERAKLISLIKDYDEWQKKHSEEMLVIQQKHVETCAKFQGIENAWESIKQKQDFEKLMKLSEAFKHVDINFHSFAEFEKSMEKNGIEIAEKLTVYSEMCKKVLEVIKSIK